MTVDVRDDMPAARTPMKAIRLRCLDCCAGSYTEVERCPAAKCPLHPFRLGRNPFRKPMSDERRAAASARMKKMQAERGLGLDGVSGTA